MEKLTDQQNMIDEIAKLMCNFPKCLNYNKVGGCINDRCPTVDKSENVIKQGYIKQEWISVEDRLPQENEKVLAINSDGEIFIATYLIHKVSPSARGYMTWASGKWNGKPTHWMPLPTPPKMKGAE